MTSELTVLDLAGTKLRSTLSTLAASAALLAAASCGTNEFSASAVLGASAARPGATSSNTSDINTLSTASQASSEGSSQPALGPQSSGGDRTAGTPPKPSTGDSKPSTGSTERKPWGDLSKHSGPVPALYLRPAAELESDKDDVQNRAQDYKLSKESDSTPEQRLWFASAAVDVIFDEADDASWADARAEAVAIAYLDCMGQYSTWLGNEVSAAISTKVQTADGLPPLAREFYGDARADASANPARWTESSVSQTVSTMSFNYVGGLATNKIFWGKSTVSMVCVVSETSRLLQAYARGAIGKDKLPTLEPLGSVADLMQEKKDILHLLSGGVFYWIDQKGEPFLFSVASAIEDDTGIATTLAEATNLAQLAYFMGSQVSKAQTIQKLAQNARASTSVREDGTDVKPAIVKRRTAITQELSATAQIKFAGARRIMDRNVKLDETRLKCIAMSWIPTDAELAQIRKAEQDELKKYSGRAPTPPSAAPSTAGKAKEESGGPTPLPGKKKPAPSGKGDSGRGVD